MIVCVCICKMDMLPTFRYQWVLNTNTNLHCPLRNQKPSVTCSTFLHSSRWLGSVLRVCSLQFLPQQFLVSYPRLAVVYVEVQFETPLLIEGLSLLISCMLSASRCSIGCDYEDG